MKVVSFLGVKEDFEYQWFDNIEKYTVIQYIAVDEQGRYEVQIGQTERETYGLNRKRVLVFIEGYPYAEFVAADDFDKTGDLLSEIRLLQADNRLDMCEYPEEGIPSMYANFSVEGLPNRIKAKGVHSAWSVVANISDHKTMISLAFLRKKEKALIDKAKKKK
ncbi:MAG: hypothetical protein ACW96U_12220 [Candidatus Heimdallarchaeaceae archaeon]|jgi:hypothetical protein